MPTCSFGVGFGFQVKNHLKVFLLRAEEEGSYLRLETFVSLNSRLESNKEEKTRRGSRTARGTAGGASHASVEADSTVPRTT